MEEKAKTYLHAEKTSPGKVLEVAKQLKNYKSFSLARKILEKTAATNKDVLNQDQELKLKLNQQLALCTFKDDDLPIDFRLDKALKILEKIEKNQETLGQIGSVYRRKGEVDNQKIQLERSPLFYRRGYKEGAEKDQGYMGTSAAFVLEWLAYLEEARFRFRRSFRGFSAAFAGKSLFSADYSFG